MCWLVSFKEHSLLLTAREVVESWLIKRSIDLFTSFGTVSI